MNLSGVEGRETEGLGTLRVSEASCTKRRGSHAPQEPKDPGFQGSLWQTTVGWC